MSRVIILGLALLCNGCQLWQRWKAEPSEVAPTVNEQPASPPSLSTEQPKSPDLETSAKNRSASIATNHDNDLELKLAKLWARVDGLENQQIQQKERMKLLEKGLMLGIIPEELKQTHKDKPLRATASGELPTLDDELHEKPELKSETVAAVEPVPKQKNQDSAAYRRLLQEAQEKFNAAQYGQAIVHFNAITEQFDDSLTEGNQYYWIALSWFYLKEFQLAEQSFKILSEQYAQNPWTAHARFYRAKIDAIRGMSQRALAQFQQILEEFPNQDLGEMARMEVARMKEKL